MVLKPACASSVVLANQELDIEVSDLWDVRRPRPLEARRPLSECHSSERRRQRVTQCQVRLYVSTIMQASCTMLRPGRLVTLKTVYVMMCSCSSPCTSYATEGDVYSSSIVSVSTVVSKNAHGARRGMLGRKVCRRDWRTACRRCTPGQTNPATRDCLGSALEVPPRAHVRAAFDPAEPSWSHLHPAATSDGSCIAVVF